jgi:hypothetical protein
LERISRRNNRNPEVIRPSKTLPCHRRPGCPFGNLAPEGAVVKRSAVDDAMLRHKDLQGYSIPKRKRSRSSLIKRSRRAMWWSSDMKDPEADQE